MSRQTPDQVADLFNAVIAHAGTNQLERRRDGGVGAVVSIHFPTDWRPWLRRGNLCDVPGARDARI